MSYKPSSTFLVPRRAPAPLFHAPTPPHKRFGTALSSASQPSNQQGGLLGSVSSGPPAEQQQQQQRQKVADTSPRGPQGFRRTLCKGPRLPQNREYTLDASDKAAVPGHGVNARPVEDFFTSSTTSTTSTATATSTSTSSSTSTSTSASVSAPAPPRPSDATTQTGPDRRVTSTGARGDVARAERRVRLRQMHQRRSDRKEKAGDVNTAAEQWAKWRREKERVDGKESQTDSGKRSGKVGKASPPLAVLMQMKKRGVDVEDWKDWKAEMGKGKAKGKGESGANLRTR